MQDQAQPPHTIRLGNVWMLAADVARAVLAAGGAQYVVQVDAVGDITAFAAAVPGNVDRFGEAGVVGLFDAGCDPVRLAGRLRDAVLSVARPL